MTPQSAKAITASRLDDGAVVWLGSGAAWVERIDDAALLDGAAVDAALAAAQDSVRRNIVLDAYAIDIDVIDGRPEPARFRERIRARGPSVRIDLGKQAAVS